MTDFCARVLRLLSGLLLGVALLGCAEDPGPAYYLLVPEGEASRADPAQPARNVIGLRELALPLYARRTQIATVGPGGAVTLSEEHRWAEEVPRASTRVVARTLTDLVGRTVFIEPWPQGTEPTVRVDIEVDYFAGRLDGELRFEGQYRIVPANGGEARASRFALTEQATGEGYEALVDSHRRALVELARIIAEELRRRGV